MTSLRSSIRQSMIFENSLIGKPISHLFLDENNVPTFIPPCCNFIKLLYKSQGIFRVPGDQKMVDELTAILNYPETAIPPSASVHDVASFLKLWMISLPEPLIVPSVFNKYFGSDNDPASVLNVLWHLPEPNRKIFAYLVSMLKVVIDNSSFNQMTISNLALCFGNSLTQSTNGLARALPFTFFFNTSCSLLNESQSDFLVNLPPQ